MNIHRILQFLPLVTRSLFFSTDSHHAFSPVVFFLVNKKFRKNKRLHRTLADLGCKVGFFCGICKFFFSLKQVEVDVPYAPKATYVVKIQRWSRLDMENSTLQWIFGVGPQKMLINTIHLRSFNKAQFFSKIFPNCHSNINFHQALQAFCFLVVGSLYLNNLYLKKNAPSLGEGNRSL